MKRRKHPPSPALYPGWGKGRIWVGAFFGKEDAGTLHPIFHIQNIVIATTMP
jgi:hypothetical protein